jgi:hypothetical protein
MDELEGYFLIVAPHPESHNPSVQLMFQDEVINNYDMGVDLWVVIADATEHYNL